MAWKIAVYSDEQKRMAFEAVLKRRRGEQRLSLQDVLSSVRGIKTDAMRRFVKTLDAAALDELGIRLEQKGPRGPVTVIFKEPKQQPAAERENAAA